MKTKQLLLVITLLAFTSSLFAQDEFTLVKVGENAPDFSFASENGQSKKLSDLKGKVVWINFFATWCGPCRKELPHLQKEVYDKLKSNKNLSSFNTYKAYNEEFVSTRKSYIKLLVSPNLNYNKCKNY